MASPLVEDAMRIMDAAAEAQQKREQETAERLALLSRVESIPVKELVNSDRIVRENARGSVRIVAIASVRHSPRGCIGNTHVKIQGGSEECYAQCATIDVIRAELPETD